MHEFTVEGMSCGHCVASITKAVQGIDSLAKVQVELSEGKVRIDSKADTPSLRAAIEDAGYDVKSHNDASQ